MKERPILFTPENASKVGAGLKTQTRRVALFPSWVTEIEHVGQWWHGKGTHPGGKCENKKCGHSPGPSMFTLRCPYGVPGDRLWIREAYKRDPHNDCSVHYRDGCCIEARRGTHLEEPYEYVKWRNGMFMPRWASRTLAELTDVRVQRVQEITYEDAKAEGCNPPEVRQFSLFGANAEERKKIYALHAELGFKPLWDSINAKRCPWSSNPWVWCLTFRRVEG